MRKTLSVRPAEERAEAPKLQKKGRGWTIAESRLDTLHETAREMRREPKLTGPRRTRASRPPALGDRPFEPRHRAHTGAAFACEMLCERRRQRTALLDRGMEGRTREERPCALGDERQRRGELGGKGGEHSSRPRRIGAPRGGRRREEPRPLGGVEVDLREGVIGIGRERGGEARVVQQPDDDAAEREVAHGGASGASVGAAVARSVCSRAKPSRHAGSGLRSHS